MKGRFREYKPGSEIISEDGTLKLESIGGNAYFDKLELLFQL